MRKALSIGFIALLMAFILTVGAKPTETENVLMNESVGWVQNVF